MSKDRYPSIFSPQMEAIVFIILEIFFATCAIFKIGEYSGMFPSFSWGIFVHVMRLDQSCASEKISWIIRVIIPRSKSMLSEHVIFWGVFYFYFTLVFFILGAFLIKKLFPARLLDVT